MKGNSKVKGPPLKVMNRKDMKVKGNSKVTGPPSKVLSRKDKRKAERKLKKARKDAFAHRNFDIVDNLKDIDFEYKVQGEEKKKLQKAEAKKKKKKSGKKKKVETEKNKVDNLRVEMEEDDIELKHLEKKLKLNKKKGGSKLPQSFTDDGLDYLLDATESDKIKDFDDMIAPELAGFEDSEESDIEEENSVESKSVTALTHSWDPDTKAGKSILKDGGKINSEKTVKFVGTRKSDEDSSSDSEVDLYDDDMLAMAGVGGDEDDGSDDDDDLEEGDIDNVDDFGEEESFMDEEDEELEEDDDKTKLAIVKGKQDIEKDETPSNKRKRPEEKEEELKEDIYGRLRDKEGNVVKTSGAYVPPAKRAMMSGSQPNEALRKRMKGLVNKISEGTIQVLSSQVESVYLEHSRADVNETLASLIMEAVITPVLSPERLVAELAMLIAILHSNVGSEVGAFFLQKLAVQFKELLELPNYGIGKYMDNVLLLLSHLYNFKIVSSSLMIDIMQKLISKFGFKDIELLLSLLKNIGFTLRKDDPAQLKQVILDIQAKSKDSEAVAQVQEGFELRIRFMLEILTALRNNNMRKIPGYDPTHLEHLRKLVKSFLRGQVLGDNVLTIGLDDLLKADQCGRWWIVGSAWEGRETKKQALDKDAKTKAQQKIAREKEEAASMSGTMLKMAKLQGMNTDVRRQIFCILGTSEDFEDAFARLLRLGLNRSQEREIIHVIFHCCLNEKEFNPFYAYLAEKFCSFDRRFTITVQFSVWDKFKEVDGMSKEVRTKLGHFLSHLLLGKVLSLSVVKVVDFGMESKKMIRLLVQVLSEILTNPNLLTVTEIFERIAPLPKLKSLCQGLQVFMRVHLKGVPVKGMSSAAFHERIEKAESAMFSCQSMML